MTVLCKTCVRNIATPHVPSAKGRCVHCQNAEKYGTKLINRIAGLNGKFERKILRGSGHYDVLVMVSGGKDSVAALQRLARSNRLRILAYTVDNGFEFRSAMDNIRRAVSILGVDWIVDRPAGFRELFRDVLRNEIRASICRLCAPIMVNRAIRLAAALGIRTIVTGWNKGQSDREPSRKPLWTLQKRQLERLAKTHAWIGRGLHEEENAKLLETHGIRILSPWVFETRDTKNSISTITRALGWKPTPHSYPKGSTSCRLNLLQVLLSRKHFGYTHYDCEESTLIMFGEKTRRQAVATLNYDVDCAEVRRVISELGLSTAGVGLSGHDFRKYSRFI